MPHRQAFYEWTMAGRPVSKRPGGPCFNNPYYRNFTLGLVEDYARSYDIGGIMWGSERHLLNTLGVSQSSGEDPGGTTCFCEFCQKKGRDRGIDVERARRGFELGGKFCARQPRRAASARRLFQHLLAVAAELSRSAGVGKSLGDKPA